MKYLFETVFPTVNSSAAPGKDQFVELARKQAIAGPLKVVAK